MNLIILIVLLVLSLLLFVIVIRGFVKDLSEIRKGDQSYFPLSNVIKINKEYEKNDLMYRFKITPHAHGHKNLIQIVKKEPQERTYEKNELYTPVFKQ